MGNYSKKPDMLTKMKAETVVTQNILVNVNNFLCIRQLKSKNVQLYLGRLKGSARQYDFNLPMGQTS